MKTYFIALFFAVFLFSACSSIKVSHDYDSSVDFSAYKTYQFTTSIDSMPMNDLNRERTVRALTNQLESKGFTQSNNPDVLVDVVITGRKETVAQSSTTGTGMGYGRGRYGWGGGMGMAHTTTTYSDYVVGTLFVNIVDAKKEQLVWQGRGEKTLTEDASPEKREKNINTAAEKIFYKYPPKVKKK